MRRLLAIALLTAGLARADVYTWGKFPVPKGYAGPVVVTALWQDGSPRDCTGVTASMVVYSKSPSSSSAGTVLFVAPMTPAGAPNQADEMVMYLTTTNTGVAGTYYAEVVMVEGAFTDVLHGNVTFEGR